MTSLATHQSHCFMIVQPENEFMGCKYGRDEDCPVRKPYPEDEIEIDAKILALENIQQMAKDVEAAGYEFDYKAEITNYKMRLIDKKGV